MSALKKAVIDFLKKEEWNFSEEKKNLIFLGLTGETERYEAVFDIRDDKGLVLFYVMGPNKVPEKKRQAIAEFITRANFGIMVGNFEMDFSDGELRYKSVLVTEGVLPKTATLRRLMYPAVLTMDRYYRHIMAVVYGAMDVRKAILASKEQRKDSDLVTKASKKHPEQRAAPVRLPARAGKRR